MISIIIPALNEGKYLTRLLESVKRQTYKDYEVIVSDACSTDKTKNIAKKYGCKVIKGGLPAVGRNKGAKIAKGEYLFFLDADVVLTKNFLKDILSEFKKRKLSVATCLIKPIKSRKIDIILHYFFNLYLRITEKINPTAIGFCILTKKDVFRKVGGFNEELKLSEDYDYGRRSAKIGRFGILRSEKICVYMRRWEKYGRARTLIKYILSFFYYHLNMEMKGRIFEYKFGKHD